MQAVHALDSDEARIPILDPDTGRHEMRRIVSVGGIPRGAGHLDDNIRIIVDLPRGSEHGPQVSQNLGKWGLKSAPGYRLLLNLAYAWHDVGRTLTPVGKGKDRRWVHLTAVPRADSIQLSVPLVHLVLGFCRTSTPVGTAYEVTPCISPANPGSWRSTHHWGSPAI